VGTTSPRISRKWLAVGCFPAVFNAFRDERWAPHQWGFPLPRRRRFAGGAGGQLDAPPAVAGRRVPAPV